MISFELRHLPTHMDAPRAWAVWQATTSVDCDGEDVTDLEVIAWGVPLGEALDEIRLVGAEK